MCIRDRAAYSLIMSGYQIAGVGQEVRMIDLLSLIHIYKLFFDKTVLVSMDCNETRSKKRVYYKAKEAADYYEVKPS